MSKKLAYERYVWFHSQVVNSRYPNAGDVARHFEVSQKTAHRDIRFIAERLGAPLAYDARRKGYYYTEDGYELPALWLRKDDVVALVLARRLAATIPDQKLKEKLYQFLRKLSSYMPARAGGNLERLGRKVSVKNVEYFGVDEMLFNQVLQALLPGRTVEITYYSPYKNEQTTRRIVPLHLLNYMGNWHLIAFCGKSRALRDFALSRIRRLEPAKMKLLIPGNLPTIKAYLEKQFGIFTGRSSIEVSLRFSPEASRWVREQVWHPRQKVAWDRMERLTLTVPVTDFREVKREVLKFGGDVEVLKPRSLRQEVIEEIARMWKLYGEV